MSDDEIIKEETEKLIADIIALYRSSGKKVSGNFEEGLEPIYSPNKVVILGFAYLAGRGRTKKGHIEGEPYLVESIFEWLQMKGITPIEKNMSIRSLAWAMTTKIHKEGTKKSSSLKIYEEIITAKRINKIIDRVAQMNVNRIITEIRADLQVLAKSI